MHGCTIFARMYFLKRCAVHIPRGLGFIKPADRRGHGRVLEGRRVFPGELRGTDEAIDEGIQGFFGFGFTNAQTL